MGSLKARYPHIYMDICELLASGKKVTKKAIELGKKRSTISDMRWTKPKWNQQGHHLFRVQSESIIDQKKLKHGCVYEIAAAEGGQIDSTKQVINVNMNGAIPSLDSIDKLGKLVRAWESYLIQIAHPMDLASRIDTEMHELCYFLGDRYVRWNSTEPN